MHIVTDKNMKTYCRSLLLWETEGRSDDRM